MGCKNIICNFAWLNFQPSYPYNQDEAYYKLILEIYAELALKQNTYLRSTNFWPPSCRSALYIYKIRRLRDWALIYLHLPFWRFIFCRICLERNNIVFKCINRVCQTIKNEVPTILETKWIEQQVVCFMFKDVTSAVITINNFIRSYPTRSCYCQIAQSLYKWKHDGYCFEIIL